MAVEIVAAAAAVVIGSSLVVLAARRRRRRRDSVGSFAAAVGALRRIAATGSENSPAGGIASHTESTDAVHVLDDVHVLSLDRARPRTGRRAHRHLPDEAIAHRPVIASLPSISAIRPASGPDTRAG